MQNIPLPPGFQVIRRLILRTPTGQETMLSEKMCSPLSIAIAQNLCGEEGEEEGPNYGTLAVWDDELGSYPGGIQEDEEEDPLSFGSEFRGVAVGFNPGGGDSYFNFGSGAFLQVYGGSTNLMLEGSWAGFSDPVDTGIPKAGSFAMGVLTLNGGQTYIYLSNGTTHYSTLVTLTLTTSFQVVNGGMGVFASEWFSGTPGDAVETPNLVSTWVAAHAVAPMSLSVWEGEGAPVAPDGEGSHYTLGEEFMAIAMVFDLASQSNSYTASFMLSNGSGTTAGFVLETVSGNAQLKPYVNDSYQSTLVGGPESGRTVVAMLRTPGGLRFYLLTNGATMLTAEHALSAPASLSHFWTSGDLNFPIGAEYRWWKGYPGLYSVDSNLVQAWVLAMSLYSVKLWTTGRPADLQVNEARTELGFRCRGWGMVGQCTFDSGGFFSLAKGNYETFVEVGKDEGTNCYMLRLMGAGDWTITETPTENVFSLAVQEVDGPGGNIRLYFKGSGGSVSLLGDTNDSNFGGYLRLSQTDAAVSVSSQEWWNGDEGTDSPADPGNSGLVHAWVQSLWV